VADAEHGRRSAARARLPRHQRSGPLRARVQRAVRRQRRLQLRLEHARASGSAALLLGVLPLYAPITPGCVLMLDPMVSVAVSLDSAGVANPALPIPTGIVGVVRMQFAILDPGGPVFGTLTLSNGINCLVAPQ
jgi:hypothetical protein